MPICATAPMHSHEDNSTHICCTCLSACLHTTLPRTRANSTTSRWSILVFLPLRLLGTVLSACRMPSRTCALVTRAAIAPQGSSRCTHSPLRTVVLLLLPGTGVLATIHFFLQLRLKKKKKSVCCHCSILVNDCGKGDPCPQGSVSLGAGTFLGRNQGVLYQIWEGTE